MQSAVCSGISLGEPTRGLGVFGIVGVLFYIAVAVPLLGVLLSGGGSEGLDTVVGWIEAATGVPAGRALEGAWAAAGEVPAIVEMAGVAMEPVGVELRAWGAAFVELAMRLPEALQQKEP